MSVATFLSLFLLALAICSIAQPSALGRSKTEWLLKQHHYLNGNARVYMTDDALRLENFDRGFQIVSKAPSWQKEIFRTDQKLVYKTDLAHFDRFSVWGPIATDKSPHNVPAIKRETVEDGTLSKTRFLYGYGEIWLANNITQSPQIKHLLTLYYDAPETGVPLYFTKVFAPASSKHELNPIPPTSGKKTCLLTRSASIVPYKAEDFAYPVGYKEVKAYCELLAEKDSKDEGEAIVDKFGFVDPSPSKSQVGGN